MRPKIVIVVLLVGIAGIAAIFLLKHAATPPATIQTPPEIVSQPAAPPVTPAADNPTPAKPVATFANAPVEKTISQPAADTNALAEAHDAMVQAEVDKLTELQANDDAASLHAILADLTNSDKEIRAAAVESTIQFGSRDAIPVLQDLAAHTTAPDEKKNLLDAADFLALPTTSEVREASRQAKMQNGNQPPDASPAPAQP